MAKLKYNPLLEENLQELSTAAGGGEDLAATLALDHVTGTNDITISDGQKIWFEPQDLVAGHSITGAAGGDLEIESSGDVSLRGSQVEAVAGSCSMTSTDTNGGHISVTAGTILLRNGLLPQTTLDLYSTGVNKLSLKNAVLSAPQTQTFQDATGIIALLSDTTGGYIQTGTTTNSTPLLLTGSFVIPNNSVQSFVTRITAIQSATTGAGTVGDVWVHEFRGAVKNISGVPSTVDTPIDESLAEDVGANWLALVQADFLSSEFHVTVWGQPSKTIKWKSETIFSEVLI